MNFRNGKGRLLSIAPSTYGFGFAVVERGELVDWGVKTVAGEKNLQSLLKLRELIKRYTPDALVLPDCGKNSTRSQRIRRLHQNIITEVRKTKLKTVLVRTEDLRKKFFPDGGGTKHRIAEELAGRFPEELGSRLPPQRRAWMSEDFRMGIFDAIALGVVAEQVQINFIP